VTTARDVGGKLEKVLRLRSDLNSGRQLGPRLFVLGPLLDGRDESFGGEFGEILDSVPSVDAVPDKIGHLLKSGVDGIKLYFTMRMCCNLENVDGGGPERNWSVRSQAARSNSWSMN
jgi:hypothetical protein